MGETRGYNDSYSECKARKVITMSLKDINDLLARKKANIDKLERDNEVLKEACEFYADEWGSWCGFDGDVIVSKDREVTENNRYSGGKKARQSLSKIRK